MSPEKIPTRTRLALAQKLLEVESILATHIQLLGEPVEESDQRGFLGLPPHEQRQVFSTMLDECVTTLIGVQDAIRERLEGKEDADFSTGLLQVAGALEVATQADAALLTGKLERALNASLANAQDEGGEPPHIHVATPDGECKFWLDPISLTRNKGVDPKTIRRIEKLIFEHSALLKETYKEIHRS